MKDSRINYLVDAGPVVGLLSRRDQWHDWSVSVLTALDEPLATTETVWGEVCHLLHFNRPALFAAIEAVDRGRIKLFSVWDRAAHLSVLLHKYPQMDVADATLVLLSEQLPRARIITVDVRDFTVYRRFRDQSLPLLHP